MKILVIGNGFLAQAIINQLDSTGNELLIYSRNFDEHLAQRQILGDIFDFDEFIKVLSWKPQVIIHTAWITTPGIYQDHITNYQYANFTARLAQHLLQTDVEHFIVLGTCAEYGHQITKSAAGLTMLAPKSIYAKQKVEALNSAKSFLENSNVRLTWARIFFPYGPKQDNRRLVPYLIDSIRTGSSIHLSNQSSIHDWITTRDIGLAISWILNKELPIEVDIGTTFGFTNREILESLQELIGIQCSTTFDLPELSNFPDMAVVSERSPLFESGWLPSDNLRTGLDWVLNA
jgi:nucleoside-diphosphate-sugar epimerase